MEMGQCQLCDTENIQLVRGHILPKKFGTSNLCEISQIESSQSYTRKIDNNGLWAYFTCKSCDGDILGQYDNIAYYFLRDELYIKTRETGDIIEVLYPLEKQMLLAKFFLSYIWRCTKLKEKSISLGPYDAPIKKSLLNIDEPLSSDFNCIFLERVIGMRSALENQLESQEKLSVHTHPYRNRDDNITFYQFLM